MIDLAPYQDPLTIQRVLYASQTIAIVGLSKKELRASYFVGYYLKRHGYHVIPVNPGETKILHINMFSAYHSFNVVAGYSFSNEFIILAWFECNSWRNIA